MHKNKLNIIARIIIITLTISSFIIISNSSAIAANLPFFYAHHKVDTRYWYISNGWTNGAHQSCEWRKDSISANGENLKLTIADKGRKIRPISCAEIRTKKLYKYGTYEARIKAATGTGLNTAFFTYAGYPSKTKHDEIDFEFLGKHPTKVQVNYWVKGKQNPALIDLGFDASKKFHNYKFIWEPSKITWFIDGKLVHKTKAGAIIPTNPQGIFMSLWSSSKTIEQWMGVFTYKSPVSAEFEWLKFTPYKESSTTSK